ncbi:hypothetical protein [Yoonia sp. 2307UL14-13]|uniref:hypothetical protein n=1 Tax=Yoonia sp. 2307UL14-13 TaxID=3126506 RepID=UPI0030ED5CEE
MQNALADGNLSIGHRERRYRRVKKPSWMRFQKDPVLQQQLDQHEYLLENGQIAWCAVIQANELLFSDGPHDHPAAFIYGTDKRILEDPEILTDAAEGLFEIKGRVTTPEVQHFADRLADETTSDLKLPVPTELTNGIQCFYTTMIVFRKHILYGRLDGRILPILTAPHATDAVTILPERYWDIEFINNVW